MHPVFLMQNEPSFVFAALRKFVAVSPPSAMWFGVLFLSAALVFWVSHRIRFTALFSA
jgi:hypothetical protein